MCVICVSRSVQVFNIHVLTLALSNLLWMFVGSVDLSLAVCAGGGREQDSGGRSEASSLRRRLWSDRDVGVSSV